MAFNGPVTNYDPRKFFVAPEEKIYTKISSVWEPCKGFTEYFLEQLSFKKKVLKVGPNTKFKMEKANFFALLLWVIEFLVHLTISL